MRTKCAGRLRLGGNAKRVGKEIVIYAVDGVSSEVERRFGMVCAGMMQVVIADLLRGDGLVEISRKQLPVFQLFNQVATLQATTTFAGASGHGFTSKWDVADSRNAESGCLLSPNSRCGQNCDKKRRFFLATLTPDVPATYDIRLARTGDQGRNCEAAATIPTESLGSIEARQIGCPVLIAASWAGRIGRSGTHRAIVPSAFVLCSFAPRPLRPATRITGLPRAVFDMSCGVPVDIRTNTMETDRNLLFGVMALQADLIDPAGFAEVCSTWAQRKDQSLADLMVEHGKISGDDRAALAHLLNAKLRKHGDDAAQSLAAACGVEAHQILAALQDSEIDQSLDGLSGFGPAVRLDWLRAVPPASERYQLSRQHAEGGLGRVWIARDGDLGRDVALKEILPERARTPGMRARFLDEARITGQLEHPGIVPVYELVAGDGDEQSSFYTMRFVRGRTLSEAILAYHEARPHDRASHLGLRELLGAFVAVLNAIAYAHSRGVVHRDLKGANIIMGDYGEVMVLDWGLAKLVEQDEQDGPSAIVVERDGEQGTVCGQVLGTPAYMSPEQAQGERNAVGPASDIYSLGVILYEILAGGLPFSGSDTAALLKNVVEQTPVPPRRRNVSCPPALEAVCLKALRKTPAHRYASAQALADDVRCWLADEPVSAYPEPIVQRAARWTRRHRTLVASAAAMLLVGFLATTVGLFFVKQQQLLTDAARQQAEHHRDVARATIDRYLIKVSSDVLLNQPGLQHLRSELMSLAVDHFQQIVDEAKDDPDAQVDLGMAYGRLADLRRQLGGNEEAVDLIARSLQALEPFRNRAMPNSTHLRHLAAAHFNRGVLYDDRGDFATSIESMQQSLALRQKLHAAYPDDIELRQRLAATHNGLAGSLHRKGDLKSAESNYRLALELNTALSREFPQRDEFLSDVAALHVNLALVCNETGRRDEATQHFETSLPMREKLAKEHPDNLNYQNDLVHGLHETGSFYYYALNDRGRGRPLLEQSLELSRKLSDANPLVDEFRFRRAGTANNLVGLYQLEGESALAMETLENALQTWKDLTSRPNAAPKHHVAMADALGIKGELLRDDARFKDAATALAQASQIYAEQARQTASPEASYKYAIAESRLGLLHLNQAEWSTARQRFDTARPVVEELIQQFPEMVALRQVQAEVIAGLAEVNSRSGDLDLALDQYSKLIDLAPENAHLWKLYRGLASARHGKTDAARAALDEVAPFDQPPGLYYHVIGCLFALLAEQAESPDARDEFGAKCLTALREAHDAGFYDTPFGQHILRAAPDLESVRQQAEFLRLLE